MSALLESTPGWNRRACAGTPTELWFGPEDDVRETPVQRMRREHEATRLCAGCPVRAACLADELRHGVSHQWGVRGGLTAGQRQTLIRSQREQNGEAA